MKIWRCIKSVVIILVVVNLLYLLAKHVQGSKCKTTTPESDIKHLTDRPIKTMVHNPDFQSLYFGQNGSEVILSQTEEKSNKIKIKSGYQNYAFNEFISSLISTGYRFITLVLLFITLYCCRKDLA